MNREEIEMQIWEYIDGTLNDADKMRIARLIASDNVWKQLHAEISALHTSIAGGIETEQPSLRFTKNVMDTVAATHVAPAAKKYISKGVVRSIAALFIVIITTTLFYAFSTANWGGTSQSLLPNINTSNINISVYFNRSLFPYIIGISIVLGLVLVDMWLRRRSEINIS